MWVLTDGDDVLAAKSRYTARHVVLEGDTDDERCAFLLALADRHRLEGWVVFPTADETAALIGRAHDELRARFVLTSPPWDMLRWAYDKRLTYSLAESLGMQYPRTWAPASAEDAASLELGFPVIVKPAIKEEFNALTAAKAWRADNREQLRQRFAEAATLLDPELLMIQEVIPRGGEQLSYAALCDRGHPIVGVAGARPGSTRQSSGAPVPTLKRLSRPRSPSFRSASSRRSGSTDWSRSSSCAIAVTAC